jgi:diguanylate cyclase (GGDEF)-like protein
MIEFLCTVAGLIAGVAIAASLLSARHDQYHLDLENKLDKMESDKMHGVALQLQNLSRRVFSDVNQHSSKVEIFSSAINAASEDEPEKLVSAIDEILLANKLMQGQLADAQRRIAEQSQIIETTTHQARTDTLTGLPNRRALDEYLASSLENKPENGLVGLLLLDIDKFKSFNDTYGHLTGDGVLKCFARSIATVCGNQAFPARYGGEEFAVVLTGSSPENLAESAAIVRQYASQQKIFHEDLELIVTASAGLSLVEKGEDLQAAYEKSDEGLYRSKQNGRNQGFWLSAEGWMPFPTTSTMPIGPLEAQQLQPAFGTTEDSADESTQQLAQPDSNSNDEAAEISENATNNYLELSVFFERVGEHLGHLQRSGLPASCFMVEPLAEAGQEVTQDSWLRTAGVIERKLRGIDLVCLFRPSTACVFLPGSSGDSAVEKASDLLLMLNEALAHWNCETKPRRFAIAAGQALENEEAAHFLDRIEKALEEAQDASETEIVVHSGQSTFFQQV